MGRSLSFPRAACIALFTASLALPASALQEGADEQYQYVAGLCERGLHDVAVREAEAFLRKWPRHEKADLARYRLASSLFELGRLDQASEQYVALARVRSFEYAAEVQFRLGQCLLDAGRPADAVRAFEQVARHDKPYLQLPATFFLGEAHLAAEDYGAASERYATVLTADDPGEYRRDAEYGLVWCAFRLGESDRAISRIGSFLRSRPEDPAASELRFLLGECQLAAGRPAEALDAYSKVRGGDYAAPALRGAAFALSASKQHAQAARQFERLAEQYPEGEFASEARLHAGIEHLRAGDAVRAAGHLRSDAAGDSAELGYWLARAELELGRAEPALAAVDRALSRRPDDELRAQLHTLRGDALADLGRADEALNSYGRAGSQYASYAAAVAALNDGRAAEAGRIARTVLEQQPEGEYTTELQLVLGEALLAEGRHAQAERAFRAVVDARPPSKDVPRARLRLGWCRFLQDDPAGAAKVFEACLAERGAGTSAEEASYMLGRSREAAGDPKAAVRTWRAHVQRFPDGANRAQVLAGLARLDTEQADRWVDALLEVDEASAVGPAALIEQAERDSAAGRTERAVERYTDYLRRYPDGEGASRARYGRAWGLYELGRHQQAAAGLMEVAADEDAADETRASALELSVWAFVGAEDLDRAFRAYRGFAETSPEDARLWAAAQVLQKALMQAERTADAGRVIEDFLGRVRTPEIALEAFVECTWWALDAESVDAAEKVARGGVKLAERTELESPRLGEACFFVAERRFEAGETQAAAELYDAARRLGSDEVRPQALYKLGFCELRQERWPQAAGAFSTLVDEHAGHALWGESLFLLGEAEYRAGRMEQAARHLERLRTEQPRHEVLPKALFRLGLALGELERWKDCARVLAELNRAAPEFPNAAEAELWRGRALAAEGDRRGARAAFERVLARDDGVLSARARVAMGHLDFAAGDFDAALSQFLRVAVLYAAGDEVAEALLYSGRCLEELGNQERAREQYRQVLKDHGETSSAREARDRLARLGN